jgi:hypothetical protein
MKANMLDPKSMVKACTSGPTAVCTTVNGMIIEYTVWEFTSGSTDEHITDNGPIMTWKGMAIMSTPTALSTLDSTIRIKKRDMANTFGQMVGSIRAIGTKENNTDWAHIRIQGKETELKNMVFGNLEKESNGLQILKSKKFRIRNLMYQLFSDLRK